MRVLILTLAAAALLAACGVDGPPTRPGYARKVDEAGHGAPRTEISPGVTLGGTIEATGSAGL